MKRIISVVYQDDGVMNQLYFHHDVSDKEFDELVAASKQCHGQTFPVSQDPVREAIESVVKELK